MKNLYSLFAGILLTYTAFAQPSDTQIKKDVVANGAHVKSFKYTKTTGYPPME
jgi:hypothetical protein